MDACVSFWTRVVVIELYCRSWTFVSLFNYAMFKLEFSLGFSNTCVIFWTHELVIELCCRFWTKVSLLNYKKEKYIFLEAGGRKTRLTGFYLALIWD